MDENTNISLQLEWVGDMISAPTPVNQILLVSDTPVTDGSPSGAHTLALGYVASPVLPGEPTPELIAQIQSQPLPVVPAGRFMLTTARLREFRDVIDKHLQQNGGDPQ